MKTEGYDPRNIVKEYAVFYRESEERRIDWENYHNWLFVHKPVTIKEENNKKEETNGKH